MSQTYGPENPGHGYLPGPSFGQEGAGQEGAYPVPPPPPRPHHRRTLVFTAVAALAIGAAAGGLINGLGTSSGAAATATSKTMLSASQIAERVDPALVDIVATDGLQHAQAAGTGIVLTANGEVLTNNHVISGSTSLSVTDVGNGRTYSAKVVGYDESHDIAVIQLQNASGLTTASLGSSSAAVGSSVVALGNAGGKGGTPSVATGTVTALDQSITASDELSGSQEQLTGLIETNADIQPGDSGGALVDAYGRVIGVNTAASTSYQFQDQSGSGTAAYAVPISTAMSIANQIESGKGSDTVHLGATAFLGVGFSSSQSGGNGFGGFGGQGTQSGASLSVVQSGSPAAKAGLAVGDTITSVGGVSISSAQDVAKALVKYHPGDSIQVSWVDQFGQSHSATATLATGPAA